MNLTPSAALDPHSPCTHTRAHAHSLTLHTHTHTHARAHAAKTVGAADSLEQGLAGGGTATSRDTRKVALLTSAGIMVAAAVVGGSWYVWDKKGRPSGKDVAKNIQDSLRSAGEWRQEVLKGGAWNGRWWIGVEGWRRRDGVAWRGERARRVLMWTVHLLPWAAVQGRQGSCVRTSLCRDGARNPPLIAPLPTPPPHWRTGNKLASEPSGPKVID